MIKVNNVCFGYQKDALIFNHLSCLFHRGSTYLITGKNGSGKTTLIKLILGFLKPKSGSIDYSKDLVISYLPDFNALYEDLSIIDNMKYRCALYNQSYPEKRNEFEEMLKVYDLFESRNQKVKSLSLGMRQKTALILTFLIKADIYIMDEPTGGLDEESNQEIIKLCNQISDAHESLLIIVTHDKDMIHNISGKIIKIENGEMTDV